MQVNQSRNIEYIPLPTQKQGINILFHNGISFYYLFGYFYLQKQLVNFHHIKYIVFGIFIISCRISVVNINIIFKNIFIFVNFADISSH